MITAVDTNILIDILEPDPLYGPASKEALKKCLREGKIVACKVVWAEVAVVYVEAQEALIKMLEKIGLEFSPIAREAALVAAKCWAEYLKRGPKKRRIAADFLIGAHALVQCDRLLTDKGFYREYFKGLKVVYPVD